MTGNRNRIALLLVLLLVGAAGVLWWADSRRLATANQSVAHTQEVSRQIELLAGNLTEMESNARGFVLGLGVAWHEFGALPPVHRALTGMSAVVAGLVLATAMKMSRAVPRHAVPVSLSVVAFLGVGLMRFPLFAVIAFVGPIGILLAWREHW